MTSPSLGKAASQQTVAVFTKNEKIGPDDTLKNSGNIVTRSMRVSQGILMEHTSCAQNAENVKVEGQVKPISNDAARANVNLNCTSPAAANETTQEKCIEPKTSVKQNKNLKSPSKENQNKDAQTNNTVGDIYFKAVAISENSNKNIRIQKFITHKIGETITPKKNWIAIACNEMNMQEDSVKKMESNRKSISPQKHIAKSTPTKLNNLQEEMPSENHGENGTITVIKINHNFPTRTETNDRTKPANEIDDIKDDLPLIKRIEQTHQKLPKTPKKKASENEEENTTLDNILVDVIKVEQHKFENISCDESTENNCNAELVLNVPTNVNIDILLMTPKRMEVLDHLKFEVCKSERDTSPPQATLSRTGSIPRTLSITPHRGQKHENVALRTPQSSQKVQNICENDILQGTLLKSTPQKGERNSDSEGLSDTLKYELCDPDRLHDFEAIDLLHDLDAVINFEDSKMASSEMLAPFSYESFAQNVNGNADVDPLSVDPSEPKKPTPVKTKLLPKKRKKRFSNTLRLSHQKKHKSPHSNVCRNTEKEEAVKDNVDVDQKTLDKEHNKEPPFADFEKLQNLHVQLLHKPPTQHTEEPFICFSRRFTEEEEILFEEIGPLRKGPLSPSEDNIITNNWKLFCKIHQWNPTNVGPFMRLRYSVINQHEDGKELRYVIKQYEDRIKFIQFLANGLPWRSLNNVYFRFKTLFNCEKGTIRNVPFSEEEDKKIVSFMKNCETKAPMYEKLARMFGRSTHSVRLRHQGLSQRQQSNNEMERPYIYQWTLPLIKKFITTLVDVTMSESIEELKYALIPPVIWDKVAQKLNINENELRKLWYMELHMQLFCKKPIYLNDVKIQFIEYMYGKGISSKGDLVWSDIINHFDGMTKQFLYEVFGKLTYQKRQKPLIDVIENLYHKKISIIRQESLDRYLPRIDHSDGKFEIINDSDSNSKY